MNEEKTLTNRSPKRLSTACCSPVWKIGDMAYNIMWNNPRVLIVGIEGDTAQVIGENGNQDYYRLISLKTKEDWIQDCWRIAEDSDLTMREVRIYIEAGTCDFEKPESWSL